MRVFRQKLPAHREELLAQGGVVHGRVAGHAGEAAVLRKLAAAVVAEVPLLLAHLGERPEGLGTRTVIAEDKYDADAMAVEDFEHPLEAVHDAVVLGAPDCKAQVAEDDARGIEPVLLHQGRFALHFREAFLAAEFLPLVNAVGAAGRHVVAAANPRLGIVPFPRFFFRPGASSWRHVHCVFHALNYIRTTLRLPVTCAA